MSAPRQFCEGARRAPLERIKPAPPQWTSTWARRYGIAQCMTCRVWFAAHKDGTPVHHMSRP